MTYVAQIVVRNVGQDKEQYPVPYEGKTITAVFVMDAATGAFLYQYDQDAEGKPTHAEDIAVLKHMNKIAGVPEGDENLYGSFFRVVKYADLPQDYSKLGTSLMRMEGEDFSAWLRRNRSNRQMLTNGKRGLRAVMGQETRIQDIDDAIDALPEDTPRKPAQPNKPPQTKEPGGSKTEENNDEGNSDEGGDENNDESDEAGGEGNPFAGGGAAAGA